MTLVRGMFDFKSSSMRKKYSFTSWATENPYIKAATAKDKKHPTNLSDVDTNRSCTKTAIKYPKGFFQLKGNLLKIIHD